MARRQRIHFWHKDAIQETPEGSGEQTRKSSYEKRPKIISRKWPLDPPDFKPSGSVRDAPVRDRLCSAKLQAEPR
jgi:hypothetical protein